MTNIPVVADLGSTDRPVASASGLPAPEVRLRRNLKANMSTIVALATVRIWPERRKSAVVGCTENCSEIAERLHDHSSSKAQGSSAPPGALGRKTKVASGVAARHRSSLAMWAVSAVLSRATGSPFRTCPAQGRQAG